MKRYVIAVVLFASLALLTGLVSAGADSGVFHFGFKKSRNGQLPSINEEGFKPIIEKYGAIFIGDTQQKKLFLTFDNGYENGYTPDILNTLRDKKVPAIFFVTGHYAKTQADLLKRMTAEGHLIGNHSWSHPDMTTVSDQKIKEELDKVQQEVTSITGQKEMKYLRPPRGIFSARTLDVTSKLGYTNVFWSLAYKDWDVNDQKGWRYAYDNVVSQLHPGAVILLHSISKDNTQALGAIIDEARKRGYEFAPMDQLQLSPTPQASPPTGP